MRNTRAKAAKLAATQTNFTDVLPFVAPSVASVRELCILGACSRGCRATIRQFNVDNLLPLLTVVMRKARGKPMSNYLSRQKLHGCLRWLLHSVGQLQPDVAGDILLIPHVPTDLMTVILTHGLRFTLTQLAAAARQRIARTEHWVQQLVAFGEPSGLPTVAEKVTCHKVGTQSVMFYIVFDCTSYSLACLTSTCSREPARVCFTTRLWVMPLSVYVVYVAAASKPLTPRCFGSVLYTKRPVSPFCSVWQTSCLRMVSFQTNASQVFSSRTTDDVCVCPAALLHVFRAQLERVDSQEPC